MTTNLIRREYPRQTVISNSEEVNFSDEDQGSPDLNSSIESWRKPKESQKFERETLEARENIADEDMDELTDGNGQYHEEEHYPSYYGEQQDLYINRDSIEHEP